MTFIGQAVSAQQFSNDIKHRDIFQNQKSVHLSYMYTQDLIMHIVRLVSSKQNYLLSSSRFFYQCITLVRFLSYTTLIIPQQRSPTYERLDLLLISQFKKKKSSLPLIISAKFQTRQKSLNTCMLFIVQPTDKAIPGQNEHIPNRCHETALQYNTILFIRIKAQYSY